jgi:hypothetical protein
MQSLPLLTRRHASNQNGPSSRVRAMAASRLRNALSRGRVTPEQAQEAMRGGELAVAKLLLPHLYQCSVEEAVPPTPVGNTTYVSPQDLANLSPLLKEMQAAGTITERDWASANQSSAGKTILGWTGQPFVDIRLP